MISKKTIRSLIDEVETEFRNSWKTLAALKEGPQSETFGNEILGFQSQLATALFRLDDTYRLIASEKEDTINKKDRLNTDWFRRRMKLLATYQQIITRVIPIGRALGDSFAWFFYQRERDLLSKHLKRARIDHTPPGVGGRGELEFVKRVKHMDGLLVLYHGITTYLRIGDFSLIDLKSLTLRAIGELKTKQISKDQLEISYILVSSKPFRLSTSSKGKRLKVREKFPAHVEQRFRKQLDVMGASVIHQKPDASIRFRGNSHYAELKKLAIGLKKKSVAYQKAGAGLMLIGLRTRRGGSTLASDLLGKSTFNFDRRLRDLKDHALKIVEMENTPGHQNDNAMIIGNLDIETIIGTIPLFWWPVPLDLLEKMFFQQTMIMSLYNPAHLIARIRELGFEVETLNNPQAEVPFYRITKSIGNSQIEIGINYFLTTIQGALVAEDGVIDTVSSVLKEAEAGRVPPNARVELNIQHVFEGAPRPRGVRTPRKKPSH
jgi:hypothetical protein